MKRRYGAVSLALVLSVLMAVMAVRDTEAITFNPTLTVSLSTQDAGAPVDVTSVFNVPKGGPYYFGQITWTPAQFTLAKSSDIPLGAVVGKLNSVATLGLANQVCMTEFPVQFDSTAAGAPPGSGLLNASVNTADTVTWAGQFDDTNGNKLPDGVEKYPDFLVRMFPGVQPLARRFGNAVVGGKPVSLNFIVLPPGATLPAPLGALPAEWGYPSLSVLQDNGDPGRQIVPSAISDNCPPLLSTTVNYGVSKDNPDTTANEGGVTIQSNPAAAGTYTYHNRTLSLFDADDDGWDNSIDTCPYNANTGDPTVAGSGDSDGDGLDDACDPTPNEATGGNDHDGDGYVNRLDDCPLVPNGMAGSNQVDKDVDNIGDDCDQNPSVGEGPAQVDVVGTSDVTVTGAPVTSVATATPAATAAVTGTAAATKTATAAATGTAAATKTATAAATKTATPKATAAATKTATPKATAAATGTPAAGDGGDEEDEGFPAWAWIVIGVAVVVVVGGAGVAFTMMRRG
jgi:hypothetical protein